MNSSEPIKPKLWERLFRRTPKKPSPRPASIYRLKDGLTIVILFFICLLAVFQKMEILAIVTIVIIGLIVYKRRAQDLMSIGFEMLSKARTAKIGDVELNVEQKSKDYSQLLENQSAWINVVLSEMSSNQIGLLLAIYKAGKFEAREKDGLRKLRARGLIFQNAPTMEASSEVWLSELGKSIAEGLIQDGQAGLTKEATSDD